MIGTLAVRSVDAGFKVIILGFRWENMSMPSDVVIGLLALFAAKRFHRFKVISFLI